MLLINKIIKNSYYDSATLMLVSAKVADLLPSSKEIAVMMGTKMNKSIMESSHLLNDTGREANPGDVIISAKVENEDQFEAIYKSILSDLETKAEHRVSEQRKYTNVEEALRDHKEADFAVVSLPGEFAARETGKLLEKGINVLLFSDNVSLEEEMMLKNMAVERDLLMMGPDCGTAWIEGVGLGFSNKIKEGSIGVVAASGTGLQEFMCLVNNAGYGISNAYGTGGRDLKEEIGAKMMLQCLKRLKNDEKTKYVVVISKPPSPSVGKVVLDYLKSIPKKIFVCFLGLEQERFEMDGSGIVFSNTLTDLAYRVISEHNPNFREPDFKNCYENIIMRSRSLLKEEQKYIRALFCGGTLASEAMIRIKRELGEVYSNLLEGESHIGRFEQSKKHTVIDLGDDEYTKGRVHPMIDPSVRWDRFEQEVSDSTTAVVLLDLELGYGSHPDPASILADHVKRAQGLTKPDHHIVYICSICGSVEDVQGYDAQMKKLIDAGVIVAHSNDEAARLAVEICRPSQREKS